MVHLPKYYNKTNQWLSDWVSGGSLSTADFSLSEDGPDFVGPLTGIWFCTSFHLDFLDWSVGIFQEQTLA